MSIDKICFVSLPAYGYFSPDAYERTGGGGAKRQIYLLSQQLKNEFDLSVVVGDYGQQRIETRDGVTLYRAYQPNKQGTLTKTQQLYNAMKRANADIYIYRGHPRKAAATFFITRLLRRHWVYNVSNDSNLGYNYENCNYPIRWLFRRGLHNANAVIAQTSYQQEVLSDRFGIDSKVVPNGYTATDTAPPKEREFVLWVGRIERNQNRPDLFLNCAGELPKISFKLIGTSEDKEYYTEIRNRCSSLPNVEFVGPVEPDQIHEYYRRAIALVNTSEHEGFPNTFLEAWRQQTPVLSLQVDPGRYLSGELETGYADGDFKKLIEQIQQLATDSDMRASVGEELEAYFRDQYDIQAVAQQYADALQSNF